MFSRYFLSIIIIVTGYLPLLSQDIRFEHLTNENGLSQNSVNCVLQDRRGFIWIGTADGLNRYDGINFLVYRHNAYNANSLSTNTVMKMHEDKFGYIWIATYMGGLNRYDPVKDNFTVFRHSDNDTNSISSDLVATICEDREANLWILTTTGLDKYDRKKNKFIHFYKRTAENHVYVMYIDQNNHLCLGFRNREIRLYNISGDTFQFIEKFIPEPDNKNLVYNGIYQSSDGIYWFMSGGQGLIGYDKEKKKSFRYVHADNSISISSNNLISITEDKEENLWIGTWNEGLDKFDRKTGIFTNYKHDPVDKYSLNNNSVYSVFIDRNNTLWISTYGGGVDKYDVYKNRFNRILYSPVPGKGLNDPWVFPVSEDKKGLLWIGTLYGGINIYDRSINKSIRTFFLGPKSIIQKSYILKAINRDSSGNIYVGDMYGLTKIDPITLNMTKKTFLSIADYPNEQVKYILRDGGNIFWLATTAGLIKYNLNTEKSIQYLHDPGNKNSIIENSLETIYKDKRSILWVGTYSCGLDRFDESTGLFTHYENNPADKNSLSHNQVSVIYEDSKNNLWIGTKGGGLNKLNWENNTFEHIFSNEGLANDVIYGILEDNNNNLWISTNNGLSKYNIITGNFKNYNISDGLINNEFNTNSYFKNEKGEMFFGSVGGVIYFQPDKIIENKFISPIVITSMKVYDKEMENFNYYTSNVYDSADSNRLIELNYNENSISFEFTALDYSNPSRNKFAYKLEGFDKEWNNCGNKRYVNYSNLNSGEYTFIVKGSNSDGVWNEKGAAVKIIINPAPWNTWWAYSLYFFFISGSGAGFIRYRIGLQNARIMQLKRESGIAIESLEEERSRVARELHDGVNQMLISAKMDINNLNDSLDDNIPKDQFIGTIQTGLIKIKNLLDKSVQEIRNISHNLHPISLDHLGLVSAAFNLCKGLKERTNINFKIDSENMPRHLSRHIEINLYRMIQEALTNIEKHSNAKNIIISFENIDNLVSISIKDDGKGFDSNSKPVNVSGFGLKNFKERANLVNGICKIVSQPGKGTEISIQVPIESE